jgi:hypothetical protein
MKILKLLFITQLFIYYSIAQPPSCDYKLLFEENFSGNSLNENNWSYRTDIRKGDYFNGVNLARNVYVENGYLFIIARQDTIDGVNENTGGGVISKHQFGFGYYETLSKPFMDGTGVHSAFWQAGGVDPEVPNRIFEIDSYEIDSKTFLGDNNLYLHICPNEYNEAPWPHRAKIPFEFREDGWLLDAFEYTPEGVVFYDNGKIVAKAEKENLVAYQKVWLTALNGFGKVEKEKQPGETLFDYFRFYSKEYPGANILSNGDFEYNQGKVDPAKPIAWKKVRTNGNLGIRKGDASSGEYFLQFGHNEEPFSSEITQKLEYIINGKYNLSAMVRSSGGLTDAEMIVFEYGGTLLKKNISASAAWRKIQINDIPVTQNAIGIGFIFAGDSGKWIEIDDVRLMIPDKSGESQPQKPLELVGDPIWHLGKKEAIVFPGDNRFFFFDRNVGLGDAITISFRLKADTKSDMTPIARMPKTGMAGWAIQLTENGGLNFRIGSQSENFCLHAKNVYEPKNEYLITCIYNNGVAEIVVDGKVAAVGTDIIFNTLDKTAPGRLGDTQTDIKSVAEVYMPETNSQTSAAGDRKIQQFKGSIKDLRIYNRAISENESQQLLNEYEDR